jgi:hypothetical protein
MAPAYHASFLRARRLRWQCALIAVGVSLILISTGCATHSRWVSLRSNPRNPLTDALGLMAKQGPKPTPRTLQLLRRYNLDGKLGDKAALVAELSEINHREPSREHLYALAEVSYVAAKRSERAMKRSEALQWYSASVVYAYQYLFDGAYPASSNPYDPEFRGACDLYNAALEGTLRLVQTQGTLKPGTTQTIKTPNHDCQMSVVLKSKGWHADDFDHVEFVSDFEVHGLRNHYHTFGLGVPLIAVRKHHDDANPVEQFYPPNLSFAVTAFLRIDQQEVKASGIAPASAQTMAGGAAAGSDRAPRILHAVLELHDPLESCEVVTTNAKAPLETDLSTPLAHFLMQPALGDDKLSTLGLLHPEKVEHVAGLYMLEPFRADKIPVVMVHGLWSTPVTWMEMFNDLRSDPAIRDNYQFWFYLYPSGQPFWLSAAKMRSDLAHMRMAIDPERRNPSLDQMVLVGHSMGGLVAKLQTVDSGNEFWKTVSDKPFAELKADPQIREDLAEAFFFEPNPSIREVVTIGTPHRGSDFSNDTTQWLAHALIEAPMRIMQGRDKLKRENPEYFRSSSPLEITNAIDSLAPKSPILPVLLEAPAGPWVKYHNIVGQAPKQGFANTLAMWVSGTGDGVVSLDSARLDGAASQIVVPTDHANIHRHPQAILEVRRVLRQHIADLQSFPYGGVEYAAAQVPLPGQSAPPPPLPNPVATLPTTESAPR